MWGLAATILPKDTVWNTMFRASSPSAEWWSMPKKGECDASQSPRMAKPFTLPKMTTGVNLQCWSKKNKPCFSCSMMKGTWTYSFETASNLHQRPKVGCSTSNHTTRHDRSQELLVAGKSMRTCPRVGFLLPSSNPKSQKMWAYYIQFVSVILS